MSSDLQEEARFPVCGNLREAGGQRGSLRCRGCQRCRPAAWEVTVEGGKPVGERTGSSEERGETAAAPGFGAGRRSKGDALTPRLQRPCSYSLGQVSTRLSVL